MRFLEAFNPREELTDEGDIDEKYRRNYRAVFALMGAAALLMVGGRAASGFIDHELSSTPGIEQTGTTPEQIAQVLRMAYENQP